MLAWMRLLIDPTDASAVVRALARPPIELRQVDLARVIQVARRRKLDLVLGLTAAIESPQVPPEARERIQRFLELHRSAAAEIDTVEPDLFLGRLIDRLGARGRPLLAPEEAAEQQASLERLRALAVEFVAVNPRSSTRDLARHLATVPPEAGGEGRAETGPGQDARGDSLQDTMLLLREEVLDSIARIGGRLGELRLDTDLDISHGVVRYLELLKLSALHAAPRRAEPGRGACRHQRASARRHHAAAARDPPDLDARRGPARGRRLAGVPHARAAPARGALARARSSRARASAWRCRPRTSRPTAAVRCATSSRACCASPASRRVHQRFGIVVHQVLERFHSEGGQTLAQMLDLLDDGLAPQRAARKRVRARAAREGARRRSTRYHARLRSQDVRAGVVRARLHLPPRAPPPARARRPRRPPRGGRRGRVRADRLQDLAPQDRRAARRRHPAVAVRARRARGLAARVLATGLLLRARRPQGAGAAGRAGHRRRQRRRAGGRRGHPRRRSSSRRPRPPPARCATTASSAPRPSCRRAGARTRGPAARRAQCGARPSFRAGAGSAGIRARACRRRARRRGSSWPSLSAACSSRSTNAWMSGSLCTARPTWRS